jgi:hypothetical protein
MKKISMVFGMLALLSLTAVGFAAELLQPVGPQITILPLSACEGGMRMPGLYQGPNGVIYSVPKMEPCNLKFRG